MSSTPRWTKFITMLAIVLMAAPCVFAQMPTGTLTGRVTDSDSGVGLPGVLVSANSPNVQGTRTAYTGNNGDYKLPFLPAGVYTVTYNLDGFTEVSREIKISAAQESTSSIALGASEVVEETIVVTGNLETISQSSTGASTYTQDEVEKLAVSRDLNEAALLAPGVTATGPGSTEESPSITISGAMSFENLFLINGVVVNENIRGQALDLFIEDAIQETTTSVSSVSAEYGRFTGGVVNVLTKSGGNQIEGSIRANLTNDDWIARNDLSPEREDQVNETYEATLGGYFWKDHVWFFTAGRDRSLSEVRTTRAVTNISYPFGTDETRLEAKLTAAFTPSHNVVASYAEIDQATTNASFGTFLDLASLNPNREDPQDITAFNYNGVLTSNFFVEAQYSERNFDIGVGSGGPQDLIQGTLLRRRANGHRFFAPTFCGNCEQEIRNNENLLLKGSYFLSTDKAGTHDLVFGYDTFDDIRFSVNHQTGSDFTLYTSDILVDDNNNIFPVFQALGEAAPSREAWVRWFAVLNLDQARPTSFTTNSFYVNDSWQVNDKLSLNLGLRYDENDGVNSVGALIADDSKVSPRLSASYDVKGDGDLILQSSFGTYVAAVANNQANSTSDGGAISSFIWFYGGPSINADSSCLATNSCVTSAEAIQQVFNWYQSVGGTVDDPFNIDPNSELMTDYQLNISIPGATSQILGTLKSPSVDEFTLGVIKRIGNKGSFRGDLVMRDWTDFYSNRLTQATGTVDTPSGPQDLTEVGNFGNSQLTREYTGIHTQFRYRLTDRFQIAANWAWSELKGNIEGETGVNGPVSFSPNIYPEYREARWNFPEGRLNGDQEHKIRAWAIYDIFDNDHHSLSVSVLQNFFSGSPYGAIGSVNVSDYFDFVGDLGYLNVGSQSFNYYFSDRDAFETDDITRTDISLNYSFHWNAFGRRLEVFVQPEILNLFDEDSVIAVNNDVVELQAFNPFTETPVEGVHWRKGNNFGQPENEDDLQRPRLFRVSIGFRF